MEPVQESTSHDAFLSSMTFATKDCDCDECGIRTPLSNSIINEAIQHHKRQKLLYDHMSFVSQERALIKREGTVSLWKLIMPPGSDPLIEFTGSSWRCILVDRIPRGRIVKITGTGIIGSSDECKSRQLCDWKEKGVYIYPTTKSRKSMGFVNEKQDKDAILSKGDTSQHIVLYIIKATEKVLEVNNDSSSCDSDASLQKLSPWALDIISAFKASKEANVDVGGLLGEEHSIRFWNKTNEALP